MIRSILVSFCVVLLCGCPGEPSLDGGSGGGDGGTSDSGVVSLMPDAFLSAHGRAVAVRGGKVYVAGNGIRSDAGSRNNDFFIVRFSTDLVRDPTFGVDGVGIADFDGGVVGIFPANNDTPFALGFDGERPVLVGNVRSYVDTGDFGMARFTPAGQLDTTFGTQGLRVEAYGGDHPATASALALQPDGKLLVAGNILNGGNRKIDIALARYEANGTFDPSFSLEDGGAGAVLNFGVGANEHSRGLFVQASGSVVVGGGDNFALARLTSVGRLDSSFGTNGTGQVTHGRGSAVKLVERTDGSLWMMGNIELTADGGSGTGSFYMKQVLVSANGVPVAGFGQNGVRTDLVPEYGALRGAALQADGKLLVYFTYVTQGRLLRLNTDGSLDPSFGTNGVRTLDITIPLFETGFTFGNQLAIDGNTAWVTDINVVKISPTVTRQLLALVKIPL